MSMQRLFRRIPSTSRIFQLNGRCSSLSQAKVLWAFPHLELHHSQIRQLTATARRAESDWRLVVEEDPSDNDRVRVNRDSPQAQSVFVVGFPYDVTSSDLKEEFADCGEVVGAHVVVDRNTSKSRGFGFVDFADVESAENALQLSGQKYIGERVLKIFPREGEPAERAKPRDRRQQQNEPSNTLFVGNLDFETTADALEEHFGEFGSVKAVRIPNTQGRFGSGTTEKGFAFIEFASTEDAIGAHDNKEATRLGGRDVYLDFAKNRASGSDRNSRPGDRRSRRR